MPATAWLSPNCLWRSVARMAAVTSSPSFWRGGFRRPRGAARRGGVCTTGAAGGLLAGELGLARGVVVDVLIDGEVDDDPDQCPGEGEGPEVASAAVVVGDGGAAVEPDVEPRERDEHPEDLVGLHRARRFAVDQQIGR